MIFRPRSVAVSFVILVVWLGGITYLSFDNAVDQGGTEAGLEKTQDGVDRASRTIQKVKQTNRDVARLTERLDRALAELRENFGELLILLNALGIDTTTIGATDDPQVSGQGPRAGEPRREGGGGGGDGRGGGDGGDPPDGQPGKPPGGPGPSPDPPSNPPQPEAPRPPDRPDSIGGLGLNLPVVEECQLVPVLCS